MVARDTDEDPGVLAQEAALAMACLDGDHASLVTACRRLVERQPACGPLWWIGARVLAAAEPAREAEILAAELADDRTPSMLVRELPEEATTVVLGWPDQASRALGRRADVQVLVVDVAGQGRGLASLLRRGGGTANLVPEAGLGQAVAGSDMVLLEAGALGESGLVAVAGSRAAAAVACDAGVPVWAVAGVGRVLPGELWEALRARVSVGEFPGHAAVDVVPARLVDRVVGPEGIGSFESALQRADYPSVPELTRRAPARGSATG